MFSKEITHIELPEKSGEEQHSIRGNIVAMVIRNGISIRDIPRDPYKIQYGNLQLDQFPTFRESLSHKVKQQTVGASISILSAYNLYDRISDRVRSYRIGVQKDNWVDTISRERLKHDIENEVATVLAQGGKSLLDRIQDILTRSSGSNISSDAQIKVRELVQDWTVREIKIREQLSQEQYPNIQGKKIIEEVIRDLPNAINSFIAQQHYTSLVDYIGYQVFHFPFRKGNTYGSNQDHIRIFTDRNLIFQG